MVGMLLNPGRPGLGNTVFAVGLTWLFLTLLAAPFALIALMVRPRRLR
jgi:Na+/pantothenate symporter